MSELHDLAPFYALDALDDADRHAFEDHLTSCDRCRQELAELRAGTDTLVTSTAEAAPSWVKDAVMDEIGGAVVNIERPTSNRRRWFTVAAAAVLAVVVAIGLAGRGTVDPIDLVLDAADAAATRVVGDDVGTVEIVWSDARDQAVVRANDLPAIRSDETYALWLIDAEGPQPAGLFTAGVDGSAIVLVDGAARTGSTIGLTVEPAGGSPQPTGEILLVAELG